MVHGSRWVSILGISLAAPTYSGFHIDGGSTELRWSAIAQLFSGPLGRYSRNDAGQPRPVVPQPHSAKQNAQIRYAPPETAHDYPFAACRPAPRSARPSPVLPSATPSSGSTSPPTDSSRRSSRRTSSPPATTPPPC